MTTELAPVRLFVALLPTQTIQDYAQDVIQALGDRYHTRTSNAPPHITLQPPFQWHHNRLAEVEQCLAEFAQKRSPVPVTLSGFGAFSPRILYINVVKTSELLALQADLSNRLDKTLGILDPNVQQRSFSPHLTVASRDLTRQTFQQAWADLQPRSVEFEFVSDRLTLLIYNDQHWQIQAEFPLSTK